MPGWPFWRRAAATSSPSSSVRIEPPAASRGDAGEYKLLHKYLRDRFANRLVLTFAEIEDLLGFPLPESARLHLDWWGGADLTAPRSAQSDSWKLAGRTATVNLAARIVVFERADVPNARRPAQ